MISLRKAQEDDIPKLYKFLHQKYVEKYRDSSIEKEKIKYFNWYKKMLNSPKFLLLVIENENGDFLGHIKFDFKEARNEIMIFVVEEYRNKGIGKKALEQSFHCLEGKNRVIVAKILDENIDSLKLFKSLGFNYYKKYKDFNLYAKEL